MPARPAMSLTASEWSGRCMTRTLDSSPSTEPERQSLRRRDLRHPIRATALAYCHGRFQTVRIVDYSAGGLQLQGCFGVAVGDEMTVELLSGHRLAGKVAWSMGSRLGVRFLQPLGTDHPALAILEQAARRAAAAAVHAARHMGLPAGGDEQAPAPAQDLQSPARPHR
jgi:hypothetical protein